ncbi:hypothetical protein B0O99DRAFT_694901 [Bisporella sp. PMI_857]|nr:hypothetical protein B0O99DRAFT_694901 [Bisporella sp. PMI_857]
MSPSSPPEGGQSNYDAAKTPSADSGYASAANSSTPESSQDDVGYGDVIPKPNLWPRKTTKLVPFNRQVPQLTSNRFDNLVELFSEPLSKRLSNSRHRFRAFAIKLKVLGESEENCKPWIVVLCDKEISSKVRSFFAQKTIKCEYQPANPDPASPFFELIVYERPPRKDAFAGPINVYGPLNRIPTPQTLCGTIIEAAHEGENRMATIGGLIKVAYEDGRIVIYAMTAGHFIMGDICDNEQDHSDCEDEKQYLSDDDYDLFPSETEVFELDLSSLDIELGTSPQHITTHDYLWPSPSGQTLPPKWNNSRVEPQSAKNLNMGSWHQPLPTGDQCYALTDNQCRSILKYRDPNGMRTNPDWEQEHQAELVRHYMRMLSFKQIEDIMRPRLTWSYKTYQNRFRDWLFPLDRFEREQVVREIFGWISSQDGYNQWAEIGKVDSVSEPLAADGQNLDWALVNINEASCLPNLQSITDSGQFFEVLREGASHLKAGGPDKNVVVSGGASGLKRGKLSTDYSYLMLAPGKKLIKTLDLKLNRGSGLRPGDSGAWIIDTSTFEVYGHVVATDEFKEAYVVPICATFENVKFQLGALDVCLPTGHDIAVFKYKLKPAAVLRIEPIQPLPPQTESLRVSPDFFKLKTVNAELYPSRSATRMSGISISTIGTYTSGSTQSHSPFDDSFPSRRASIATTSSFATTSSVSNGSHYGIPYRPPPPPRRPKHDPIAGTWNNVLRVIPCNTDHSGWKWDSPVNRCQICGFSQWHSLMVHAETVGKDNFVAVMTLLRGIPKVDFAGNFPIHYLMSAGVGLEFLLTSTQWTESCPRNVFDQNPLHVFNPLGLGEQLISFLEWLKKNNPALLLQRDIKCRTPLQALLLWPLERNLYPRILEVYPLAEQQLRALDNTGQNIVMRMNEASMKIRARSPSEYAKIQGGITEIKLYQITDGRTKNRNQRYGFHNIARGGRGRTYFIGHFQCDICNQINTHTNSFLDQMFCAVDHDRDRYEPDDTGMTPAQALITYPRHNMNEDRSPETPNQTFQLFRFLVPHDDPNLHEALHALDPEGNSLIYNIAIRGLDEILEYVLQLEHPSRTRALVNFCARVRNGEESILDAVHRKIQETALDLDRTDKKDLARKHALIEQRKRLITCKHLLRAAGAVYKPDVMTRLRISD